MVDRYFTLVNIILITIFVGIGTGTFYTVITDSLTDPAVRPLEASVSNIPRPDREKKRSLSHYLSVAKRNLFKVVSDEAKPEALGPNIDDLEQTDLQLTLWGTISGGDAFAWAIIEEKKNRKQALYKVGDSIQNATLTHVLRNKVILNVNGKDEILEVEEGAKRDTGRRSLPRPSFSDREEPSGDARKITVERDMIDESLKDLNKLMKDVRIRPHFKDGEADGLIISGIRGNSVFKQLGLRNGDIIMGVDGNRIESVDDAMKLYGGLKNMENMKVEIKRRGKVQTLDFDIK